eukprot:1151031-Pelagomonas_calceolata.AAC.2
MSRLGKEPGKFLAATKLRHVPVQQQGALSKNVQETEAQLKVSELGIRQAGDREFFSMKTQEAQLGLNKQQP